MMSRVYQLKFQLLLYNLFITEFYNPKGLFA